MDMHEIIVREHINTPVIYKSQGPVVQSIEDGRTVPEVCGHGSVPLSRSGNVATSIVSLTSSLRGQLHTTLSRYNFITKYMYTDIFFEKMRKAFALQKLLTFFLNKKYWHISDI